VLGDVGILFGAVAVDLIIGEPPALLHPVVWMGQFQTALRCLAPQRPLSAFAWGAFMAAAGPVLFGGATWLVLTYTDGMLRWTLAVFLLKSSFAIRGLATAALRVSRTLSAADLEASRYTLSRLVSRPTQTLTPPLVAAAAIESVAENASDSIVAPLLFFALGGVPAAVAYRAVNTLDAMIGYRGHLEWLGKAGARLDDLANLVPARLTAATLVLAAPVGAGSSYRALAIWARDRALTESPNAGHPMAAMAGALGVELEKLDAYRLGAGLPLPASRDIRRAVRIMSGVAVLAVMLVVALKRLGA
jgi:adenosylcobinamide-phosphate synthase